MARPALVERLHSGGRALVKPARDDISSPGARVLALFDADPQRAEQQFAELREQLKRFMEWRGCRTPDDFAQETILRGIRRLSQGTEVTSGDPRGYFFGVARHVIQEGWKPARECTLPPETWARQTSALKEFDRVDARLTLDKCLDALRDRERTLIVRYHSEDRRELARELGLSLSQMRLRVHRIRRKLELYLGSAAERSAESK